jgi:hypothetical protein
METLSSSGLQKPDRRSFLWSMAGLGAMANAGKPHKGGESKYFFLTQECEVRLTVEYFTNNPPTSFRFRDRQNSQRFCLSAEGARDQSCLDQFVGSMAIAHYDFRSRSRSPLPRHLRERVVTIDYDSRLSPRPPFERVLAVEQKVLSDIQAFGYRPGAAEQDSLNAGSPEVWRLLRQDLYFNEQSNAFLIVHWKHTPGLISLLDVIPGDGTELVRGI